MAEQLAEDLVVRNGPPPKYPWKDWMNGNTWRIRQGVDFDKTIHSFVAALHAKARNKGMKCKTRTLNDEISFQFYTPEA